MLLIYSIQCPLLPFPPQLPATPLVLTSTRPTNPYSDLRRVNTSAPFSVIST